MIAADLTGNSASFHYSLFWLNWEENENESVLLFFGASFGAGAAFVPVTL